MRLPWDFFLCRDNFLHFPWNSALIPMSINLFCSENIVPLIAGRCNQQLHTHSSPSTKHYIPTHTEKKVHIQSQVVMDCPSHADKFLMKKHVVGYW